MNKIEGNYAEAKRLNLLKLKGQFMAMIMLNLQINYQ